MNYIIYFLLFLYSIVSMLPFMGSTDKAGNQWLFLSILNLISLSVFFISKQSFKFFTSPLFKVILAFFILCIVSISFSNNVILSLHDISRQATFFVSYLFISAFLFSKNLNIKLNVVFAFFVFSLIIESYYSLQPIIYDLIFNSKNIFDYSSININALIGLTGNRNITTAAIAIKLPFLYFFIIKSNNYLRTILLSSLIFICALPIFLISSRAALLSFSLLNIVLILFLLFKSNESFRYFKSVLIILFTLCSYIISVLILPSSTANGVDRLQSIALTNESSSNRLTLWSNAIDYITNNPIIGAGIGNWKIESAYYWGSLGENYLVPFHAHNDFLEYTTELGILGGILYFLIFLISFVLILKFFNSHLNTSILLLMVLGVYFIDSFFNFPFERPIMQVPFIFLLAVITSKFNFSND